PGGLRSSGTRSGYRHPRRAGSDSRDQHQPVRSLRGRRGGSAGRDPRLFLQQDAHRTRAPGRRGRSPGGARRRDPARADLGHRLDSLGLRRAGGGHPLGLAHGSPVLAHVRRVEGPAGPDPRRLHVDSRRDRRRPSRRCVGEAGRGLPRSEDRQRPRELVSVRVGDVVSPDSAGRTVCRTKDREGLVIYREAGQLHATYAQDQRIFPIRQDRIAFAAILLIGFVGIPLAGNDYWFNAILIPVLILSLAALGLNILTGYAGQLSLGSAGFMAVGAFAAYNFMLRVPHMPVLGSFFLAGLIAAVVGLLFGLPSLRIKGFYLAVTTLAAQFVIEWALTKFAWFSNYNPSGVISAQKMVTLGYRFESPVSRYLLTLGLVSLLALAAKNLVRSRV